MNKLKLHLEDLQVDTVHTTTRGEAEGDRVRRAVHVLHAVHLSRLPHLRRELQRHLRRELQRHLRRLPPTCDVPCEYSCGATVCDVRLTPAADCAALTRTQDRATRAHRLH